MNRNKTPILCCNVWGHKFIFNKKVVLLLVIFRLLPLSVNQLLMYELMRQISSICEATRGSLYENIYLKAMKQREKIFYFFMSGLSFYSRYGLRV